MKHLFLALALIMAVPTFAQDKEGKKEKKEKKEKEKKPRKDEKFFYKETTIETDDYKVYIEDAVALDGFSKFKMKVFNKTNDFLFIKPSEIVFKSGDKVLTNNEKSFVVNPNDEDYKVIDFKGQGMQLNNYTLELKGFYKASSNGKPMDAPLFDLPATKNDFTVGNFSCVLKNYDANTDRAYAKFECTYNGDNIGIINPYKSACIMPNGQENATSQRSKGVLLERGKSDGFSVTFKEIAGAGDLQKKSIKVKWNDTFKEAKLSKLKEDKVTMEYDAEKSAAKK